MILDALKDFVTLFYPHYCLGCNESLVKGENLICTSCILDLPPTDHHLVHENPLWLRLHGRVPVSFAIAFFKFRKKGKVQHLLHALKYKNVPEVGVMLGKVGGERIRKNYSGVFDAIVPVPLHRSKTKVRGYNQSAEFGKGLACALDIPMLEFALARNTRTETQTRKNKLKRWENVESVFEVANANELNGKHILLVDDVVTTGATLEACLVALMESGCSKVSVACVAAAQ